MTPIRLRRAPGQGLLHRGDQHPQDPAVRVALRQIDLLDAAQGPGRGGVAGQDDELAPVGEEIVHRLLGEALHHAVRAGAVGNPGVVAQVEIVVIRQELEKLPQHHQAAESGIKHADHG